MEPNDPSESRSFGATYLPELVDHIDGILPDGWSIQVQTYSNSPSARRVGIYGPRGSSVIFNPVPIFPLPTEWKLRASVMSVLKMLQGRIQKNTRDAWPDGPQGTCKPHVLVGHDVLEMWFGTDDSRVLEIPSIKWRKDLRPS